jgi:hypothetical protein
MWNAPLGSNETTHSERSNVAGYIEYRAGRVPDRKPNKSVQLKLLEVYLDRGRVTNRVNWLTMLQDVPLSATSWAASMSRTYEARPAVPFLRREITRCELAPLS